MIVVGHGRPLIVLIDEKLQHVGLDISKGVFRRHDLVVLT